MHKGLLLLLLMTGGIAGAQENPSPYERNDAAVQEVLSGARGTASAAWWGFNAQDATVPLQAALDSPAKTVTVPYMGAPWIVRPLMLHGNQEIVFEPGVIVLARKGEFRGGGDSLFRATMADNLTLRGYGAVLRMRKKDYQNPPYDKAEWRMGIALSGCRNVLIEGLRIESSGGDGIYVDGGGDRRCSENITVRQVTCHDNHRQGISVISVENLLVDTCVLSGTGGTPPESGIDFEPDTANQCLKNCVVRQCVFENNAGNAAAVYLKPLTGQSDPVTITFERCVSRMGGVGEPPESVRNTQSGGWGGMTVGAIREDGPKGLIEFRNCVSENTGREGARIYDDAPRSVQIRFSNCSWKNAWLSEPLDYDGPKAPISIILRRPELTPRVGGVEFIDCHVYDAEDRPALVVYGEKGPCGVSGVSGTITVHNPHGARADLGADPQDISLQVIPPAE